jgi:hypothetical protein
MGSAAGASCMRVELRSREVLVAWAAYCLVHAAACREQPLLQYGVGLDGKDLRHLVLGDRAACNAQLAVAAYLQSRVHETGMFSGRDGGLATIRMAAMCACNDAQLMGIWKLEIAAAEACLEAHWGEVHRKQEQAKDLRRQLQREKEAEQAAQTNLSVAKRQFPGAKDDRLQLLPFQQAIRDAKAASKATEAA